MKALICLTIIVVLPAVNGILCSGYNNIPSILMNSSLIDPLKSSIYESPQKEERKFCGIRIIVDYPAIDVRIYFTKTVTIPEAVDGHSQLVTDILLYTETIKQTNSLRYSCSTYDYCEINFLFHHIDWLINDGYYETLVESSLFLPYKGWNPSPLKCHDSESNDPIPACPRGKACIVAWSDNKLLQSCHSHDTRDVTITTNIYKNASKEERETKFSCNTDLCNNNETVLELQSLIDQFYNLTPMRQGLNNYRLNEIEIMSAIQSNLSTDLRSSSMIYQSYFIIITFLYYFL